MLRFTLLFMLFAIQGAVNGQGAPFAFWKGEIAFYADIAANAQEEVHRARAHEQLISYLDSFFLAPGSFNESLDSIRGLTVVKGDQFRIVTWQWRVTDDEYKYGGRIQTSDRLVQLKDTRPFFNGAAYTPYSPAAWYGCLYYDIRPFERDKKTYYLLLGFHAEDHLVNTRVADVLDLNGPEPIFGLPVFVGNEDTRMRLIFTYADASSARMVYDTKLKGVVHDHLVFLPGVGPEGEPLPVSDGSLEAWVLKKGQWEYVEEVYDVKQNSPPMTDEAKDKKENRDILGRPIKDD